MVVLHVKALQSSGCRGQVGQTGLQVPSWQLPPGHELLFGLLTTMLQLPLVVLQAKALQLSGWVGQGLGQIWRGRLQLPSWQVPVGHVVLSGLSTTMVQLPVVRSHSNVLQALGCLGQVGGHLMAGLQMPSSQLPPGHVVLLGLLTTMLHCPEVVLQAKALQGFGFTGQGEGQMRSGMHSPPWQLPLGQLVLSGLLVTTVHRPVLGLQLSCLQVLGGLGHVASTRSHFIVALLNT